LEYLYIFGELLENLNIFEFWKTKMEKSRNIEKLSPKVYGMISAATTVFIIFVNFIPTAILTNTQKNGQLPVGARKDGYS